MTSERWTRINELFEAASLLDQKKQSDYLARECGDDPELREIVADMLSADRKDNSLLDGIASDALQLNRQLSRVGEIVGPYRLVRQLGKGGMGDVYLAERSDGQFEQQVALKLVRRGMDSDLILERFQSERQILARLQHPNIARLLDGGVTESGQPYFAMEYVDGTPVDEYCDAKRLTIDQRLALFRTVCLAVTYAHANLVVHRDLKPSNVLVTDDGKVKLLDFGIAKVVNEDDAALDGLTRTGFSVMTPAYASPEQVRGEPVNTSTDVYSLGVVLYELLTGAKPYQVNAGNLLEAARVICDASPERPSTSSTDVESVSQTRRTNATRLRRRLSGDIDVICLKALRKEPARRYGSVDEMGDDIERHLDGRPIMARAESATYRVGKFVRRNRIGVGVSALALATLVAVVSSYTIRLQNAVEEADGAADFLIGVIGEASQFEQGKDVTVADAVRVAADRVVADYADNPGLRARIQFMLGSTFSELSERDLSQSHYRDALQLQEDLYGKSDSRVDRTRYRVAQKYVHDDPAKADSILRKLRQEGLSADGRLWSLEFLEAQVATNLGDHERSERLYRKVIADKVAAGHDPSYERRWLANLMADRGRHVEAIELYNQLIEAGIRDGAKVAELNGHRMELAYAYSEAGNDSMAVEVFVPLLPSMRDLTGETGPWIIANSNLANAYFKLGEFDEAERHSRLSLDGRIRLVGEEHQFTIVGMMYYANIVAATDLDAARPYFEKVMTNAANAWPDGNVRVAEVRELYAKSLMEHGLHQEALGYALDSWKEYERTPSASPKKPAEIAGLIASLYREVGDTTNAKSWDERINQIDASD